MAANLLARQQRIASGKVQASKDNLVGVNLQASKEVMQSAPYLTHLDFVKGVREFTELADYAVINIAHFIETNGIAQYYRNPDTLHKLMSQTNRARLVELGKSAALDFERFEAKQGKTFDYSESVERLYVRQCIVSTQRPMLLFIAVNLEDLSPSDFSHAQKLKFLEGLVSACTQHEFDGLVLKQDRVCPEQAALLKRARELAPDLVVISQGYDIMTGASVAERLQAGATAI